MIRTLFNGFCMALADSVPGVSGGTIAFIMGFYERLLDSVHGVFRERGKNRRSSALYLVKLGCGWAVGMSLSLLVLARVLDGDIYILSSAFLGLTIAAIPFIIHAERATMRGHAGMLVFVFIGAILVAGLSLLRQYSGGSSLDFSSLASLQYLYIFIAGAVAISAMILPGISGSTLLLIFGVYAPAILAGRQLLGLQLSVLPGVTVLGLGIICGLALSIGIVRRMLKEHRAAMMYLIIGLMVGSLCAIVMGPTTLSVPLAALSVSTFSVPGFLLGVGVLIALELLRSAMGKNRSEEDVEQVV